MDSLSPESSPLIFEPDSLYVVFVMREGQPRVGVFHHNSENKGILAFADVELPEIRRSHCKIVSVELKNRVETEFTIVAAHRVANLHYHEWLPNEHFACSEVIGENRWISTVLDHLDEKRKRKKLVWLNRLGTEPPEFYELASWHAPSVLFLLQAFYMRDVPSSKWSR